MASLILIVLTVWLLVRRRWISAGVSAVVAAWAWYWYETTEEIPRELIPYFPHFATLLVLVLASQRLRMPAADGQVFRREGR